MGPSSRDTACRDGGRGIRGSQPWQWPGSWSVQGLVGRTNRCPSAVREGHSRRSSTPRVDESRPAWRRGRDTPRVAPIGFPDSVCLQVPSCAWANHASPRPSLASLGGRELSTCHPALLPALNTALSQGPDVLSRARAPPLPVPHLLAPCPYSLQARPTRACDSSSLLLRLAPGLSLHVPSRGCGPQSPRLLQAQKVECGCPSALLPVPSASPLPRQGLAALAPGPPRRAAQGPWLEEPRGAALLSALWPLPRVLGEHFSSLGGEMGTVPLSGKCGSVGSGVCVRRAPRTGPGGGWVCVG